MIGLTFHDDVKGATFSEVMVAMALVSVGVM
jgi:Tfp pilus assembly protein PilV